MHTSKNKPLPFTQ